MPPRKFSLDEARRALPLIKRIAEDLQAAVSQLTKIPGGTSLLYEATTLTDMPAVRREQAETLLTQIRALIEELSEIRVEVKGFDPVLVDFLSERDGEEIYLCWSTGESDITHWHSLSGGFRGRQPL